MIYFVDGEGHICMFAGPLPGEKEDARKSPPYDGADQMYLDNSPANLVVANPKSPKLAVVDYVREISGSKEYDVCTSLTSSISA
jgi:hypothetical protein